MKSTSLLALLAMLAAAISTPLMAGDHKHAPQCDCQYDRQCDRQPATDMRAKDGFDIGMQAVPHGASADTPGYGWRYFADPDARRAVVISPQGDYYYSYGKGLRWIAAEQK